MAKFAGNFFGAFADGAILFPLLAVLAQSSYSSTTLLLFTGLAYWASGLFFKIPMPVQPLKAIAIAVAVSGAALNEVRFAGALLGVYCLVLLLGDVNRWIERIPRVFVHGIQLGLGLLLIRKGAETLQVTISTDPNGLLLLTGAAILIALILWAPRFSLLGCLATVTFFTAALTTPAGVHIPAVASTAFEWSTVLALALPQMVLTSANSVVATVDLSHRYYGAEASRVTPRRLLGFIGIGNLLSALVSGLPFCHGAGGLTAHWRGGSTTWISNTIIGTLLMVLAVFQDRLGIKTVIYPPIWMGTLLLLIGFFHAVLAKPSWTSPRNRVVLIFMGAAALGTGNMLWALVTGLVVYVLSLERAYA